jgi:hypothetical protein
LSDARKGRARGPARRKPAAAASVESKLPSIPEIKITATWDLWQTDEHGNLVVGGGPKTEKIEKTKEDRTHAPDTSESADTTMAPPIARNVAGEPAEPRAEEVKEAPEKVEKAEPEPKHEPEPEVTTINRVPVYTDVSEPIEPNLSSKKETSVAPASSEDVAAASTEPAVELSTQRDEPEAASAALAESSSEEAKLSTAAIPEAGTDKSITTADERKESEVGASASEETP